MLSLIKQALRGCCPPIVWSAARRFYRFLVPLPPPPLPYRLVNSLQEVDAELDRARKALNVSCEASFAILDSFQLEPPTDLPADPRSREYYDRQMEFYRLLSERPDYEAYACEQLPLADDARDRPFPYYTRSCQVVGEQLMAMGYLIRLLNLPVHSRILEFGPGYGRLTLELARTDFRVSAVEINPLYVDLIREHAARERLDVNVTCSGMLDFTSPEKFDCVLFYECFHHCDDHEAMIERLDALVAPDGVVVFAGEPIVDNFPMPWGLRRDGRSLWAIRLNGWFELGFHTDYFLDVLTRHGWTAEVHACADVPWQRVFIARRAQTQVRVAEGTQSDLEPGGRRRAEDGDASPAANDDLRVKPRVA